MSNLKIIDLEKEGILEYLAHITYRMKGIKNIKYPLQSVKFVIMDLSKYQCN